MTLPLTAPAVTPKPRAYRPLDCIACGDPILQAGTGRVRLFCDTCRVARREGLSPSQERIDALSRPCACGGRISPLVGSLEAIRDAVELHQGTLLHQRWRATHSEMDLPLDHVRGQVA